MRKRRGKSWHWSEGISAWQQNGTTAPFHFYFINNLFYRHHLTFPKKTRFCCYTIKSRGFHRSYSTVSSSFKCFGLKLHSLCIATRLAGTYRSLDAWWWAEHIVNSASHNDLCGFCCGCGNLKNPEKRLIRWDTLKPGVKIITSPDQLNPFETMSSIACCISAVLRSRLIPSV